MTTTTADLVAENLACRRGARLVNAGVSFRLAAGAALVLRGANGSGKTSLLRLLATLIIPAGGRILWSNAPVEADIAAYRAQLNYIGHQDAVKPELTLRETLMFWAAMRGVEPRRAPLLAATALGVFALDGIGDWPCRWLSAGQRRRLALSRLIAAPAKIWLLDEPTSGLDQDSQLRLEQAIAAHRAAGGRAVIASHTPIDMTDAAVITLDGFAAAANHAPAG